MSDKPAEPKPDLLLEASRAFHAAGSSYANLAVIVSGLAVDAKATATPQVRAAILCDAAALRLAQQGAGGYAGVVELLAGIGPADSEDNGARVDLLRALARGQEYRDRAILQAERPVLAPLVAGIIDDLRSMIRKSPGLFQASRHFWDRNAPIRARLRPDGDQEDDLIAVYANEETFRTFIAGQ